MSDTSQGAATAAGAAAPGHALRGLPQVDRLIEAMSPAGLPVVAGPAPEPHALRAEAARQVIAQARAAALAGDPVPSLNDLAEAAVGLLRQGRRRRVVPVINATGVLLHTNLGRAPLGQRALAAIEAVSCGYSNLEFDLAQGRRGSRYDHARELLMMLTGAEAALVVNNNAAAVLLALSVAAKGREVVISRGELIEIGGEFRIPEILVQSGATLREVGTTNRTHRRDYEAAIGERTAAIMKVHPSNYEVVGFVKSVPARDLAEVAHGAGLPLIHDVGSGLLRRRVGGRDLAWLAAEPSVDEALSDGADVVTFSGDKLLGGPQAGIILGRVPMVAAMERSPLLRTYRVDKTTLAALEATLLTYLEGSEAELPLWSMALAEPSAIGERAEALRESLGGTDATIELSQGFSTTGGGSAPGCRIPTIVLGMAVPGRTPADLRAALVGADPPVIARVEADRLVLDLRSVAPDRDAVLAAALQRLLA